jgi:hypothetical protein
MATAIRNDNHTISSNVVWLNVNCRQLNKSKEFLMSTKDNGFIVKRSGSTAGAQEAQPQSTQRNEPQPQYTQFQRNEAYTTAADGVADRFLETHRKVNEGKEFSDRTLLKLPSDALRLSPDYGFLTPHSSVMTHTPLRLMALLIVSWTHIAK